MYCILYCTMSELDKQNCFTFAIKIADKKYSVFMGLLPLVFIIIELIKLNADIEGTSSDIVEGIKTSRVIASVFAAILMAYTALGGLSQYIQSDAPFRDSRIVWWIASGIEGTLIFIVLAVFQFREYNDGQPVYESPFFWVVMSLVVGMISFFLLKDTCGLFGRNRTDGKLIAISDDEKIISFKLTACIIFSVWLGYRPANPDFDTAGVVILISTLVVALLYSLMIKDDKRAYIPIIVWSIAPIIVIASSFYKSTDDIKTLQYVYMVALIVAILIYLAMIFEFYMKSRRRTENSYIETNPQV